MEIKWTETAINDIDNIRVYIKRDSTIYSEQFIKKIFDSIEKLLFFPKMGRQVKEANNENIRELIFQNYRIIYLINRKYSQINIISIFHCGRDMTKISKHPWEII